MSRYCWFNILCLTIYFLVIIVPTMIVGLINLSNQNLFYISFGLSFFNALCFCHCGCSSKFYCFKCSKCNKGLYNENWVFTCEICKKEFCENCENNFIKNYFDIYCKKNNEICDSNKCIKIVYFNMLNNIINKKKYNLHEDCIKIISEFIDYYDNDDYMRINIE